MANFKNYSSTLPRDIADIPFEAIENDFNSLKEQQIAETLQEKNQQQTKATKFKTYESLGEASREQEDDSLAVPTLSDKELEKIVSTCNTLAVQSFDETYKLTSSWKWLAPQLLAEIGRYQMPEKVDGKYRALDFLRMNVGNALRNRGIYRLLTKVARGTIMETQTAPENTPLCALVPVYMAAQKKFNGINYSEWSTEGLEHLVEHGLYEAMVAPQPRGDVDAAELLLIRDEGLKYTSRSKKTPGKLGRYNPETYHMLSGIQHSAIGNLPKYAKVMLTQIWCAHPVNRHKYMILDPYNWDNMPQPLISSQVLRTAVVTPANAGSTVYVADLPW